MGSSGAERWRRVDALLEKVLALPEEARQAYLDDACGGDQELRQEVHSLLKADREAEGFLEGAVGAEARSFLAGREGRLVGAYRILGTLGSGGMSTVYLGERADRRFEKKVAVKVIQRGMATEEVQHRFRQERQILASLDHPNVARLLDACTTSDGLPAFVLEHVEGEPMDRYCDRRGFGVEERLKLFRTVCSAVHYAHQNLVVHRDLKPSNILVTAEGVPKLLDFGIAKILAPESFPQTVVSTRPFGQAMTPSYACPEQVRGEAVTTASDVYSLGVLLYELLTGVNPHRLDGATPAQVEKAVCEVEPRRASAAVTRNPQEERPGDGKAGEDRPVQAELPPVARAEGGRKRLQRRLAGDLDTILAKALQKDPRRRYASAEQLSEDLHRHLLGLPVEARPDTAAYRLSKLVRRHRVAVAVALLIALVLVTSAIVTARQSREAQRAQARAELERARAELERDRAKTVSVFLNSLFEVSDPSLEGSEITAGELLDRGAERIPRELADQPLTRAELMRTMGRIYRTLGLYDRAVPLLEESAGLLEGEGSDPAGSLRRSLNELGLALFHQGSFGEAAAAFRRSLAVEAGFGEGEAETAALRMDAWNGLALVLNAQGEGRRAEELYRQALGAARQVGGEAGLGEVAVSEAASLNGLALTLFARGDDAGAEEYLRQALELRRRVLGAEHQETAQSLHNLASVLYRRGKLEEAEALAGEALELRRSLLGEEHPEVVRTLNLLATLRFGRGDLEGAEELYRRLVDMRRRQLGEEHPEFASGLNNLARVLAEQGRPAEAEPLYRRALALKEKLLGPDHPGLAVTLQGLGAVVEAGATEEAAEAEALYRRALSLRRQHLVAGHRRIAESLVSLGRLLGQSGACSEAVPLLEEAVLALEEDTGGSLGTEAAAVLETCRGGSA